MLGEDQLNQDALWAERGLPALDGVLMDLGVSSPQIDNPARLFVPHHPKQESGQRAPSANCAPEPPKPPGISSFKTTAQDTKPAA